MLQKTAVIFEESGVAIAVHDPFIQNKFYINVLFLHNCEFFCQFVSLAFNAECNENRQIAELVNMVVNGADAKASHGGEEQASVEGAQFQQEPGQQTKIVQQL